MYLYRANATRFLYTIKDTQIIQQVERDLKQENLDRNPVVASATLVSGEQLIEYGKRACAGRWGYEVFLKLLIMARLW